MQLLEGVRVLSFNHFLAGPLGAQILADLGADVIAVEPIEGAFQRNWAVANHFVGGTSINHLTCGRNKRSLSIDLKSPEGLEAIKKLVTTVDIVMENFRPGTMDKLGLGYNDLREINPGIIYAVCSGYGFTGPYKDRPGQDLLLQALSGLAMRTGRADGAPTPVGSAIVDHHAASLYATSILAALYAKEKTGQGRFVEVSLYQAAIDLQIEPLMAWLNGARSESPRGPEGIASWFSPGPYGVHPTADGYIALSMATPSALAKALSLEVLADMSDEEGFTRREEVTRAVAARLLEKKTSEWVPILDQHRIWYAPVQDYDDLQVDPQLAHLGTFKTMTGAEGLPVTFVMSPARFDGQSPEMRRVPQSLGAQSREILAEAGYGAQEIDRLVGSGAVKDAAK